MAKKKPVLYTIGYEGASVPGVARALQGAGVRTLIDVRDLPRSRRAGFTPSSTATWPELSRRCHPAAYNRSP